MRILIATLALLAGWICASWVAAQTPGLIDRPSPPPCAADGTCYPNTEAWGYYPVRWRTWPGVALEPTAATGAPTPADLGPELTPHETPPAELEDKQAPPNTTKRPQQAPAQPVDEGAEGEAPSQTPPTAEPTTDSDPPPAFPLSMSARARSAVTRAAATSTPQSVPRTTASDPPPAPPWGHRASL